MAECDGDWNSLFLSRRTGDLIDDGRIRTGVPDGSDRITGRHLVDGDELSGSCRRQGPVHRISFTMTKADGRVIMYDGLIVTILGATSRQIIVNGSYQITSPGAATAMLDDEGTWVGQKPIT